MVPAGGVEGVPVAVGTGVGGVTTVGGAVGGVGVSPPSGGLLVSVAGGGETVDGGGVEVGAVGEGWVAAVGGGRVTSGVALGSNTTKGGNTG